MADTQILTAQQFSTPLNPYSGGQPVRSSGFIDTETWTETEKSTTASSFVGEDGVTFSDFLDVVNPLQNIPVVSSYYRESTGDEASMMAKLAGGALYGGLFGVGAIAGFAASLVNTILENQTGKDVGGHVIATLQGTADAPDSSDSVTATMITAMNAWLPQDYPLKNQDAQNGNDQLSQQNDLQNKPVEAFALAPLPAETRPDSAQNRTSEQAALLALLNAAPPPKAGIGLAPVMMDADLSPTTRTESTGEPAQNGHMTKDQVAFLSNLAQLAMQSANRQPAQMAPISKDNTRADQNPFQLNKVASEPEYGSDNPFARSNILTTLMEEMKDQQLAGLPSSLENRMEQALKKYKSMNDMTNEMTNTNTPRHTVVFG